MSYMSSPWCLNAILCGSCVLPLCCRMLRVAACKRALLLLLVGRLHPMVGDASGARGSAVAKGLGIAAAMAAL